MAALPAQPESLLSNGTEMLLGKGTQASMSRLQEQQQNSQPIFNTGWHTRAR
jgi:hypothetical protein